MQVHGDAAHNNFQVVYFGFNLSQVILGSDRLTLAQQVLDEMGISSVYFDMSTYLMQKSSAVKLTLRDLDAVAPVVVTVRSMAQPAGVTLAMKPAGLPGDFVGVLNVQKTTSSGGALKVFDIDVLTVEYQDAPGHMLWSTANVLLKQGKDLPAVVYHDLIYIATDAQDLPVMAVVTDDIRVQKVDLYYRIAGSPGFVLMPLQMTDNHAYTAQIPASAVTPLGVEYYLVARDSKQTLTFAGTAAKPNFVVVQPRTLVTP
jgi:hypothetical protein